MKKILMTVMLLALLTTTANAQTIEFYTPNIVRVVKTASDADAKPESRVVIAKPENVKVAVAKKGEATTYTSNALVVTVSNGAVTFATRKGEVLLKDEAPKFTAIESGIDAGSYKVGQAFDLDKDEPIYGLGLLQNGKMSQRGEHRNMMQSNLEDFAHFFQSIKGYGIYWDNYSPTRIDDNANALTLTSQVGKAVDYYFMYGENADGVIAEMRHLTGHVPMLPMWTYGFHQSRERYKSSAELLEVVRRYRKDNVPLDGIIQDWQYWGNNYLWNAMDFLNEDFSNAQAMIDEVHKSNAHISISIWASFGPHTLQYKELKERGELFDFETWPQSGLSAWPPNMNYPSGVRVYDCYSSGARDIYWKYLSKMHKMGIDGWWMDSTDPDHHNYKDSDLDQKCAFGSWRSVRNLFPFMTVGGVDEHQRAADKDKRVFILTRSYFAGQQRYGANTWSGDVSSSWDSFRKQVPICLNYTLTANPNVNTDIGGFFAGAYNRRYNDNSATKNPQYQELYVRWMQFGLFCPMMRSHGTEVYRELYYYGKPGEPVYDALRGAVGMRYRLMPYIYSLSWQVSKNDDSFMRALMMDFKDDKNVWDNNREFMFGHNFLVCPVVNPLFTEEKIIKTDEMSGWDKKDGEEVVANGKKLVNGWPECDWSQAKTYDVYLPAGAKWYDFWTNTLLDGGQNIKADAPLAHSPLYVRAGSIIPWAEEAQNTVERDWSTLTLRVYPGADAQFTLYEDEGDNYNYEKGQYTEIPITWNDRSKTLTIGQRKGQYEGMIANRKFIVTLPDGTSKPVQYSGKKVTVKF